MFVFGTTERKVPNDNMKTPLSPAWEDVQVRILTPSAWSAEGFYQAGVRRELVHVLPHGVDVDILKPACSEKRQQLRNKFGWADDSFVFMSVCSSRLEEKGVPDMLSAFQAISVVHPQARLVLKCLKGKGVSAIQARADPTLLADGRITFMTEALTWREMAEVYTAADAYVSAYRAEGFNIPVLEASACGLLVIASTGGPTDEFLHSDSVLRVRSVEERVYDQARKPLGVMLRPEPSHLQSQMLLAMYDDELRQRAAVAGPKHAREGGAMGGYTWEKVVDALVGLLKDAAAADSISRASANDNGGTTGSGQGQGRSGRRSKSKGKQRRKARAVVEPNGASSDFE
jgi:glycosyltransferase involved in cell wall biosynthesis